MKKNDRFYEDMPHRELIVKRGQKITIPSIFMFTGGCEELFAFIAACEHFDCEVYFENENLSWDKDDPYNHVVIALYANIAHNPTIPDAYNRYKDNLDTMTWGNVKYKDIK